MRMRPVLIVLCAAAAAAACSMPSGESERQEAAKIEAAERAAAAQETAGAEGKAEEGRLSIRAPGIDIAINAPEALRGRARADADSEVLPPGARVSGLHVEGDRDDRAPGRDSVELRFVVEQPVGDVAAWYRDPARREHFTMTEARREGEALVLQGSNPDGAPISVRLTPRQGGTDGRLVLVDRD